jgi:hypothetical protein
MDYVRRLYSTVMQIGTDPTQQAPVTWQWCQPGALDLPYATPFRSRDWNRWETWPELGEVQYATRDYLIPQESSQQPGTAGPCGSADVWENGYQGTIPPDFPLNGFGDAACCGGLLDYPGRPTFGWQAQPFTPCLATEADALLTTEDGHPIEET